MNGIINSRISPTIAFLFTLQEKFGVSTIAAGAKSSLHESFAPGSQVEGQIACRSSGGTVRVLLFPAALASIGIAALACVPASVVELHSSGGAMTPMIGTSVVHGIFTPICMAVIPRTSSPKHTGIAFAVVEV